MRIKGKFTIGAAATGLIGVGSALASVLSVQNENTLLDSDESIFIETEGEETVATPVTITQASSTSSTYRRPGRVRSKGLKDSGEIAESIMGFLSKIKDEAECNNRGGEWKDEKCIIPEELNKNKNNKDINLDERFDDDSNFSRLGKDECHEKGGYYKVTSEKNNTESCVIPGIKVIKDFEKEISQWEKVVAVAPEETMKSLSYFFKEDFMEIRKENEQYAVLFPENKLTGDLANWKFPGHLKQGNYGAAIKDICEWSKKSMGNNWTTSFLYNGKSGRGWDCQGNKEIIFYTEEETEETVTLSAA